MRSYGNRHGALDLLNGSFISIPHALLDQYAQLGLTHREFVVLLQVIGSIQVAGNEIVAPQEIARLCDLNEREAAAALDGLLERSFLAIVESSDEHGNLVAYFDLQPLWAKLANTDEQTTAAPTVADKSLVTLFEQEFGRPLSGLECEQIRQWRNDGYPEWLLTQALREAVLANKYNFRYMDRILYDWQRNRVRTPQDLDQYRQSYRERTQGREETAATSRKPSRGRGANGGRSAAATDAAASPQRDERYSAFYDLFPDT